MAKISYVTTGSLQGCSDRQQQSNSCNNGQENYNFSVSMSCRLNKNRSSKILKRRQIGNIHVWHLRILLKRSDQHEAVGYCCLPVLNPFPASWTDFPSLMPLCLSFFHDMCTQNQQCNSYHDVSSEITKMSYIIYALAWLIIMHVLSYQILVLWMLN